MLGVKRFRTDDVTGITPSVVTNSGDPTLGGIPATNVGFFVIEPNNANQSGIQLHANNSSTTATDCTLLCINGETGQHFTGDFAILSKTVNVVGSNSEAGTTAIINMYGATDTIGSPDA